jgi:hypothetical protein
VKYIDFSIDFVAENSNKLQKLGLEGKNQLNPQRVHTWDAGMKNKFLLSFYTWSFLDLIFLGFQLFQIQKILI